MDLPPPPQARHEELLVLLLRVVSHRGIVDSMQADAANAVLATVGQCLGLEAVASGIDAMCSRPQLFSQVGGGPPGPQGCRVDFSRWLALLCGSYQLAALSA
jgi:hypothetical protein